MSAATTKNIGVAIEMTTIVDKTIKTHIVAYRNVIGSTVSIVYKIASKTRLNIANSLVVAILHATAYIDVFTKTI